MPILLKDAGVADQGHGSRPDGLWRPIDHPVKTYNREASPASEDEVLRSVALQ